MRKRFIFCVLYYLILFIVIAVFVLLVIFAKVKLWVAAVAAFCIGCVPIVLLHKFYRCPHCGRRLNFLPRHRSERYDHCPYCGNKLDKPM